MTLITISVITISDLPVKIFWNAVSTFVESKAEVSMNDNAFFSAGRIYTCIHKGHEMGSYRRHACKVC